MLAAGYATRLGPLTDRIPKMLLPLAGRAMLDYLLDRLEEVEEVDEIHLVTNGRFAAAFERWAGGRPGPLSVRVHDDGTTSNEDRLGAIGDLHFTIEQAGLAGHDLLVVAGDNLIEYSLADFAAFWREKGGSAVAVHRVADRELIKQYGVVELDEDDRVVALDEKPAEPRSDLAATAAYLYAGDHAGLVGTYLDEGNAPDAPGYFLAWLHTRVPVYGYRFEGAWLDIGNPEQLLEADNRIRGRRGLPPRDTYSLEF